MELKNYWLLLIWIFIGGAILVMAFPQREEIILEKKGKRWGIIPAIMLMLPYTIWAGFRGSFADTGAYRRMFFEAPSSLSQISDYILASSKDKGYSVLVVILKSIVENSDTMFFLIIAIFQSICLVYIFRKYSSNYWTSIFLFIVSGHYLSWMFNGMRQFIAVCICFACTDLILKKKYALMIPFILLASTIHGTAIIMIPLVFIAQGKAWNKRTVLFIGLTLLAVIFVDKFTNILDIFTTGTQYEGFLENEDLINDDGTNPIRVFIFSIPAIISFIYRKYINNMSSDSTLDLFINMSIITAGIYAISMVSSGILLGRLPIYTLMYTFILLPWQIENIFDKKARRLVYMSMVTLYCTYFYYEMHFMYGLI